MHEGNAAQRRFHHRQQSGGGSLCLPSGSAALRQGRGLSGIAAARGEGGCGMIEAAMIWNEPNNKSHWDPELDPDWSRFARMCRLAGEAIAAEAPGLPRVLGGISPIDPNFIANMQGRGALDALDIVAVHGFPLDWNLWPIDSWPEKLADIAAVTDLPIWVSECGASSFGAEEVQEFGLRRTADLLIGRAPRIHWYSLFDLPQAWPATTRHKEAEGSSYYRHFYMGLVREDGTPKRAAALFPDYAPDLGICQWFHFDDHRLDDAALWLKRLGVRHLRTGLSWADSFLPDADSWFDRMMRALEPFDITVTFCFTPEERGLAPHHTSPPLVDEEFADFCARMLRRYWRAGPAPPPPSPPRAWKAPGGKPAAGRPGGKTRPPPPRRARPRGGPYW